MAAIAKFISYDGGIAFSERAMKIQRRDGEPVIIPLDEVISVRVRRPQEDSDGFIRVDTSDGGRYHLLFDDDELSKAVQFKRQFDVYGYDAGSQEAHESIYSKNTDQHPLKSIPKRNPRYKGTWVIAIVAVAVILVVVIAVLISNGRTSEKTEEGTSNLASGVALPLETQAQLFVSRMTDPDEKHRVISVKEDSIEFGFWIDGMAAMIEAYQSPLSDGTEFKASFPDDWNAIIASWVDTSEAMLDLMETSGAPDAHLIVCMIDDRDQGKVLLGIYDGEVVSDIVNGIGQ